MARLLDFGDRGSGAESSSSAFLFIVRELSEASEHLPNWENMLKTLEVRHEGGKVDDVSCLLVLARVSPELSCDILVLVFALIINIPRGKYLVKYM